MQSFLFVFFFHFLFFLYFLLSCNCKNAVVRKDSERPHVPFTITSYRTLYCSQFSITRKNDAGTIHRGHSVFVTFTCSCMCVYACTHACVCVCMFSSMQFYHVCWSMWPPPQARYRKFPSQGSLMLPFYNYSHFPVFSLPHPWQHWPDLHHCNFVIPRMF